VIDPARENRPIRSADSLDPPTFFHALVARGRSPTNAKFIFDLDQGTTTMATSAPDSPLYGPVWSVGPSLSALLENGCFGFSWMRRVTPSSAVPWTLSTYFFLIPCSSLTPFSSSSYTTVSFALALALRILFLFLNSTDSRRVAENAKRSFTVRDWNELVILAESIYYHLSPPLLV